MNSPVYTLPSDFSTPKPHFYSHPQDLGHTEFLHYLSGLQGDISALGKEIEFLRADNAMLKGKIDLVQKEKEKHINAHAREKFELEKALMIEQRLRKDATKELRRLSSKYESLMQKKSERSVLEASSEKNLKRCGYKGSSDISGKLMKMQKEQNEMKKKIRELENESGNKSAVARWDD